MILLHPQLQAFLTVVDCGTVHGAAQKLLLTQTAITQRIKTLEQQLNTTLFLRSRRGMKLTPSGEALLRYCQASLELEGQTLPHLTGAGFSTEARLRLVGPTSLMSSRIVPALCALRNKFSSLFFTFSFDNRERRIELLRKGEADLILVSPRWVANEMDSKLLRPERYVLVASSRWAKIPMKKIFQEKHLIDFDEEDAMSLDYLRHFRLLDKVKSSRHFVNDNLTLIEMFAQGMGYGVLSYEVALPYFKSKKLIMLNSGKAYESPQALAWYPRAQMPQYFLEAIKYIQ